MCVQAYLSNSVDTADILVLAYMLSTMSTVCFINSVPAPVCLPETHLFYNGKMSRPINLTAIVKKYVKKLK